MTSLPIPSAGISPTLSDDLAEVAMEREACLSPVRNMLVASENDWLSDLSDVFFDTLTCSAFLPSSVMAPNTPSRAALLNKTNVLADGTLNSYFSSPYKRSADDTTPTGGSRKRVRLFEVERDDTADSDASDSDVEMEDSEPVAAPKTSMFWMMNNLHRRRPNTLYTQPACEHHFARCGCIVLRCWYYSAHATYPSIFCVGK